MLMDSCNRSIYVVFESFIVIINCGDEMNVASTCD